VNKCSHENRLKRLILMVRAESFELPTLWV
jgi:hypothetical protein